MVEILPFNGIRYADDMDIEKVVAPPYDVIPDEARDDYYNRHENNVIHLILGKEHKDDTPQNNRYTRARDYFNSWLQGGVLKKDDGPSIYLLEQEYSIYGERKKMRGIISLVKLEEFEKGVILPHEETLIDAIDDRLNLMSTCGANFSQIFTMYSDPEQTVDKIVFGELKNPPVAEVEVDGVVNRLWRVKDPGIIKRVEAEMKDKQLFIADGHHRYSTALLMRDRMRKETGTSAYDYTMMHYTNMDNGGITILAAHRLLKNVDFEESRMKKIGRYFDIEKVEQDHMFDEMEKDDVQHVFGMCFNGNCYLLRLKEESVMDNVTGSRGSKEWKRLDVTIIHALLIDLVIKGQDHISYVIDRYEAIKRVKEGRNVVIFVRPTRVEDVKRIALNGEVMPGKATYFYPKLLTGLVMNKID